MNHYDSFNFIVSQVREGSRVLADAFNHDPRTRDVLLSVSERLAPCASSVIASQSFQTGLDPFKAFSNVEKPVAHDTKGEVDAGLVAAVELREVTGDIREVLNGLSEIVGVLRGIHAKRPDKSVKKAKSRKKPR